MIDIVIIGQNESESIPLMINSLKEYSFNKIWVLDRCIDNSAQILQDNKEFFIKTPDYLKGRLTSLARNLGFYMTDKYNDVLFLDGDRYLISGDLNQLKYSKYDIELLFLEDDFRSGRNVLQDYGKVINSFYSCGIFIRREALNKIASFQEGYIFDESIQNYWGIEDTYLGDVCYHLGLTCNYNETIRLKGTFSKTEIDNINVIEKRFKKRDKLNVLW
jgi:hypothetical protein